MRLGCVALQFRVAGAGGVFQRRLRAEHFQNLLCIGLPIGCAVQVAAHLQARCQLGDQAGLNQAAFVVLLFVLRVLEKDVHTIQALQRQHVVNDFYCVVGDDANVG